MRDEQCCNYTRGVLDLPALLVLILTCTLVVLPALGEDAEQKGDSVLLKRIMQLESELKTANGMVKELSGDLHEMTSERDKLNAQIEFLKEQWDSLKSDPRFTQLPDDGQSADLRKRIDELQKQNSKLRADSEEAEKRYAADLKRAEKRGDSSKYKAKIEEMSIEFDQDRQKFNDRIEQLKEQCSGLEKDLKLSSNLEKPSDREKALAVQLENMTTERDRLQSELESLHASGKAEPVKSGEEADRLNAHIAELERINSRLKIDLAEMREVVARQKKDANKEKDDSDNSASADPRLATAQALFERGSVLQAESLFQEVLKEKPNNMDVNLGLAYCYYQRSLYSEALRITELLSASDQVNAEIYRLKGLSAWRCGDLQLAVKSFAKAIELKPGDASLHNYLGVVKFSQGDFETARRQFVLAVELDDKLVEANYNLAVLYSTPEKNDLKQAQKYYERAIQLGRKMNENLEKKIYR